MRNADILRGIQVTLPMIAGSEKVILTMVSDNKLYGKDGKPTGEVDGKKYHVVCPKKQYFPIIIKVPSIDTPIITQEELEASPDPVWITFDNFIGSFYLMDGDIGLSCSASKAVIIAEKKPAQKVI